MEKIAAIHTAGLTKRFPAEEKLAGLLPPTRFDPPAVSDVSLSIAQGELFGLLGPNGAGKTTLVKILATLVAPSSGDAWITGVPLGQSARVKAAVGLVTTDERSFYWRLTGRQNLAFFGALHGLPNDPARLDEIFDKVQLAAEADKPFRMYSTGMRQRLAIARALLHRPTVLFLDEPTRGLDPPGVRSLHRLVRETLLREEGMTILLTTHWLDEAEQLCDRVAVMHRGSIRGIGTLPELRRQLGETGRFYLRVSLDRSQGISLEEGTPTATVAEEPPVFVLPDDLAALNSAVDRVREQGGLVESIERIEIPLEDIFDRLTAGDPPATTQEPGGWELPQPLSASKTPSFLRIAIAFLRRDLQSEVSYRFAFLLQFAGVFFSVAVFYFVAQLLGPAAAPFLAAYGGDYFSFVLIGIAFQRYFGVGLTGFASTIRRAQTTGTLEAMLTTPTSFHAVITASSLWTYLATTVQVAGYLLVGGLFLGVDMAAGGLGPALLVLFLSVIVFSSLGIFAASFIMVLKRGDPVTWVLSAASALLGGVYYPVAVLPDWLEALSRWIPVTYALEAMRLALLQGTGLPALLSELGALAGFAAVLFPLSLLAFNYAVQRARLDGSLTHY
jgi:ABC-2 type transport system permease protein